ncbi:MAG: hypothetical protein SW833_18980 [Cyanobacteriota bacterium]|nr:hypothetical protein [Cyanobacteriota bacterium]
MKTKIFNLFQSLNFRPLRFLVIAFTCGILILGNALPAAAATSNPREGEASLDSIQAETDTTAKEMPSGLKETQKNAQKGLNAVQGAADKEKMESPESADSTSFEEQVKEGYKNLFGN